MEREKKKDEFEKLEQGNMTVDEYIAKFLRLAQYFLKLVPDEAKKARKF